MFDTIEPFADYSFNKSHTVGYGLVTFQTAYLKANHPRPVPRRAAHQRQGRQGQVGDLPERVPPDGDPGARPRRQRVRDGLRRAPDGHGQHADGDPVEVDAIRFGLSAVRNVGEGVVGQDPRGARRGRPVRGLLRRVRAGRSVGPEQAHGRVTDQGGCVRLARSPPPGPVPGLRGDRRRDPAPGGASATPGS